MNIPEILADRTTRVLGLHLPTIYKKGPIEFGEIFLSPVFFRYEMSRVELGRDRLPRRMDIQSPGSTGLFWRMVGLAGFFL